MSLRISLGPVFVYDMLSLARRWQTYVARALFVLILLIGMLIAWKTSHNRQVFVPAGTNPTLAEIARVGEHFFYALAGIQLSFILLAAPAAAAGSICIDRARGTLLHMMVTDLADAEIVLGRLGARLVPVFGLVACGVPVLALAGLLGGIDFFAIAGLLIVSVAMAILGCSLALAISVKAAKTHEVLMAVFMVYGAWLLAVPMWWGVSRGGKVVNPPDWFQKLNPFVIVYSPYAKPGFVTPADFAIFFAVIVGIAFVLIGWSILRLRRAVIESTGRGERPERRRVWVSKLFPSMPGPSLDGNPVLWREWHRNRPSRLARRLWRGLLIVCWSLVAWGTYQGVTVGIIMGDSALQIGFTILTFFGLLIVAATSATVLAEERTRGSLDILLSTPLSTRSIVMAKWWGAYRVVLGLLLLPAFVAVFLAWASPDTPQMPLMAAWSVKPSPLRLFDRIVCPFYCIGDLLVSGALIVSIGVALATWIPRIGRAVGVSIVIFVAMGIGLPILIESLITYTNYSQSLRQALISLSPAFGTIPAVESVSGFHYQTRDLLWVFLAVVISIKAAVAGILLIFTLKTFERCLGRVVESRPEGWKRRSRTSFRERSRRIETATVTHEI